MSFVCIRYLARVHVSLLHSTGGVFPDPLKIAIEQADAFSLYASAVIGVLGSWHLFSFISIKFELMIDALIITSSFLFVSLGALLSPAPSVLANDMDLRLSTIDFSN